MIFLWLFMSMIELERSILIWMCSISAAFSSGSKNRGTSPYKPSSRSMETPSTRICEVYGSFHFTLGDILKATKNFSAANIIGEGGFGTVFKGQLRDGTVVAIKRAKKVRKQY